MYKYNEVLWVNCKQTQRIDLCILIAVTSESDEVPVSPAWERLSRDSLCMHENA